MVSIFSSGTDIPVLPDMTGALLPNPIDIVFVCFGNSVGKKISSYAPVGVKTAVLKLPSTYG